MWNPVSKSPKEHTPASPQPSLPALPPSARDSPQPAIPQSLDLPQPAAEDEPDNKPDPTPAPVPTSPPAVQADLPVPSNSDQNNFFKQSPKQPLPGQNDKSVALAQAVAQLTSSTNGQTVSPDKSPSGSSAHSQSAVHPLLKQQSQTPFSTQTPKINQTSPQNDSPSVGSSLPGVKYKTRSGGRPKDPVWIYFHTNGNGTDERATCKYCGWHVERPKAFRMRDHIAQCAQVDPQLRAEMAQLIAFKEAAAVAKQEEKAQLASASAAGLSLDVSGSASKKRKIEAPVLSRPVLSFGKSPITSHVLDATSGKPGDEMGIRLDRLTSNGFVLIANGTTDQDGRCNTLLPGGSRPEVGIYKVTFFSNEFYQKRGIVSFYPFVEITFEIKDPTEHYHIPLLLSPYAFSTYRGS